MRGVCIVINPLLGLIGRLLLKRPLGVWRLTCCKTQTAVYIMIAAIAMVLIMTMSASADNDEEDTSNFTLYWENDAFARTDRDYTNGLKFTWSKGLNPAATDRGLIQRTGNALIDRLPLVNDPGLRRGMTLSIGHSIYNPHDIQIPYLIEDDRPYAAFLYGGLGLFAYNRLRLSIWEFDFGVIGPLAFGEEVQNQTHDWLNFSRAKGWDHQLENEPTFGVISETKWRLWQWEADNGWGSSLLVHLGGRLGNVAIYGNTGAEFRFGWRPLNDFGSCPIRPGCDSNHIAAWNQLPGMRIYPFGFFFFVAADGRLVLHDIFLDGNTFTDSHSVEKEPLVADLMGGIVLHFQKVRFSYSHVLRTRQFKEQKDQQLFGALTFTLAF